MTDCQIRGCRRLEWKCADCGRVANTASVAEYPRWISVKKGFPPIGQFVAAIRLPWPSFYWMGKYEGVPKEDEDMFDYWMPLPEAPIASQKCQKKGDLAEYE